MQRPSRQIDVAPDSRSHDRLLGQCERIVKRCKQVEVAVGSALKASLCCRQCEASTLQVKLEAVVSSWTVCPKIRLDRSLWLTQLP